MALDKVLKENSKFKLLRREYTKRDVVYFVINKDKKKSIVFRKLKQARIVYDEFTKNAVEDFFHNELTKIAEGKENES